MNICIIRVIMQTELHRCWELLLDMTGKIEHEPLVFVSGFLSKKYDTSATAAQRIDEFDEKFAKYRNVPLCSWNEEDAKQFVEDLRKIYSV